jgi:hypothetical protein
MEVFEKFRLTSALQRLLVHNYGIRYTNTAYGILSISSTHKSSVHENDQKHPSTCCLCRLAVGETTERKLASVNTNSLR